MNFDRTLNRILDVHHRGSNVAPPRPLSWCLRAGCLSREIESIYRVEDELLSRGEGWVGWGVAGGREQAAVRQMCSGTSHNESNDQQAAVYSPHLPTSFHSRRVSRTGPATSAPQEAATDPMGPHTTTTFILLIIIIRVATINIHIDTTIILLFSSSLTAQSLIVGPTFGLKHCKNCKKKNHQDSHVIMSCQQSNNMRKGGIQGFVQAIHIEELSVSH